MRLILESLRYNLTVLWRDFIGLGVIEVNKNSCNILVYLYGSQTWLSLRLQIPGVGWGWGWGPPSLKDAPFSASGRSFCPPKFDHVYHFIQILLGPISKAPIFRMLTIFFRPQIDKFYHSIQILLGPILNFEWRTPTDFYPECPPGCRSPKYLTALRHQQEWGINPGVIFSKLVIFLCF